MNTVYKVLGLALLVGGLLLWLASALPPLPTFGINAETPSAQVVNPPPPSDDGYVTLSGIVVYDDDRDAPVPYIAYERPGGGMRTKQLIFHNDGGCSPEAGDLPCATGSNTAPPVYPSGTRITVSGTILGDQILVDRITS